MQNTALETLAEVDLATVTGGQHDPTECYDPAPVSGIIAAPSPIDAPPIYVCTPI